MYCHDPSQNTPSQDTSQSGSTSEMQLQYQSPSTTSETGSKFELPDAVLDFIHWAEDPSPPLFTLPEYQIDQFKWFCSSAWAASVVEPDLDKESTSQSDTGSITKLDYEDPSPWCYSSHDQPLNFC